VWRPVIAERIRKDVFRIIGENEDPEDERWEFSTGQLVRCEERVFAGGPALIAVEELDEAV